MSSHPAVPLVRACSFAAVLALVACSPDASREPFAPTAPTRSSARVALPFRGTLETMDKSMTPLGPTTALFAAEGTGTATHLGRYTAVIALTLDFATSTGTEQITLTAANGDVLTATATAGGTPTGDGVTVNVVETATITGGTGRFAGATGEYVVNCVANQATGVAIGSFNGTITLRK
jgi:hypothetical protein